MGGQLRQRAGVVRPAELVVVFATLGCFGSIPGSPRLLRSDSFVATVATEKSLRNRQDQDATPWEFLACATREE
eukprot:COSAG02_NODE_92_length_37588_cov_135.916242_22_plen_74_part_00